MSRGSRGFSSRPWLKCLVELKRVSLREFRPTLTEQIRYVDQQQKPVLVTYHGAPVAVLISLERMAILERIENDPELLEELKKKFPELPWDSLPQYTHAMNR